MNVPPTGGPMTKYAAPAGAEQGRYVVMGPPTSATPINAAATKLVIILTGAVYRGK